MEVCQVYSRDRKCDHDQSIADPDMPITRSCYLHISTSRNIQSLRLCVAEQHSPSLDQQELPLVPRDSMKDETSDYFTL